MALEPKAAGRKDQSEKDKSLHVAPASPASRYDCPVNAIALCALRGGIAGFCGSTCRIYGRVLMRCGLQPRVHAPWDIPRVRGRLPVTDYASVRLKPFAP
jgi:hypothetical protein